MLLAGGVAHRGVAAVGVDRLGHEAAVPAIHGGVDLARAGVAPGLGGLDDTRIGIGQYRQPMERAGARHLAIGQPGVGRAVPFVAEQRLHGQDGLRDARHQREAIARIADGRREHVRQRPRAVVAQHGQPRAERAGHGGGHQADAGHQFHALGAQRLGVRQRGRRALAAD
ncbi:hypothetical protein D3C72_1385270 [compost metagenome]